MDNKIIAHGVNGEIIIYDMNSHNDKISYEQGFKPGWGYGYGLATPTCTGALAPHHGSYNYWGKL